MKPSKTQHEKMKEHLAKANAALARSKAKAQASLAAHLAANNLTPPESPGGGTTSVH
jgi:hypothetical protein